MRISYWFLNENGCINKTNINKKTRKKKNEEKNKYVITNYKLSQKM